MAKWITSPKSQAFKDYRKLLSPHGLKKSSHYLLSGNKVLQELLSMDPDSVTEALYPSEEMASTWQVPGPVLAAELFKEIDVMGTGGPIFCVKKQELATWQPQPPRGLTVFSPLGDPRNVGALLRSSLAFGADQVVLLQESASPYLPEALRAASGSHLHLKLWKGPSLSELKGDFVTLSGDSSTSLINWPWPKDVNLLVGEEGLGLQNTPKDLHPTALRIPIHPRLESLNAAVALSLALYEYRRAHPQNIF